MHTFDSNSIRTTIILTTHKQLILSLLTHHHSVFVLNLLTHQQYCGKIAIATIRAHTVHTGHNCQAHHFLQKFHCIWMTNVKSTNV